MRSMPARVDTYEAMLAGLIHNIGTLPILTKAETEDIFDYPVELDTIVNEERSAS